MVAVFVLGLIAFFQAALIYTFDAHEHTVENQPWPSDP